MTDGNLSNGNQVIDLAAARAAKDPAARRDLPRHSSKPPASPSSNDRLLKMTW